MAILSTFADHDGEMGITEIGTKLGFHKSTANRLIKNLESSGFLQQNPITKKYFLGRVAIQMGQSAVRSLNNRIISTAIPFLEDLTRQTGETSALEILSGYNVILAFHIQGPSHLHFTFRRGGLVYLNVSVGAKSILSHAQNDFLDICLQRPFKKFNENTIVSKEAFRAALKKVRAEGVAYDRGERYQEIHAIGAPILLPGKPPESAVVIAGPASRMTDAFLKTLIVPIKKTAADIAQALLAQNID